MMIERKKMQKKRKIKKVHASLKKYFEDTVILIDFKWVKLVIF